jgi:hypothetical protein
MPYTLLPARGSVVGTYGLHASCRPDTVRVYIDRTNCSSGASMGLQAPLKDGATLTEPQTLILGWDLHLCGAVSLAAESGCYETGDRCCRQVSPLRSAVLNMYRGFVTVAALEPSAAPCRCLATPFAPPSVISQDPLMAGLPTPWGHAAVVGLRAPSAVCWRQQHFTGILLQAADRPTSCVVAPSASRVPRLQTSGEDLDLSAATRATNSPGKRFVGVEYIS